MSEAIHTSANLIMLTKNENDPTKIIHSLWCKV